MTMMLRFTIQRVFPNMNRGGNLGRVGDFFRRC
jgi:hypothetical protein